MKCYSDVEIVPVGGPEEDGPQTPEHSPEKDDSFREEDLGPPRL